MYIFEIALVIAHCVWFAFLFVQTVLHDGGSGLRLYDGSNVSFNRWVCACCLSVAGPTVAQIEVELLLWIFCVFSVLCLLCVCARLFICALWSPAGKGLTSWLSFRDVQL